MDLLSDDLLSDKKIPEHSFLHSGTDIPNIRGTTRIDAPRFHQSAYRPIHSYT